MVEFTAVSNLVVSEIAVDVVCTGFTVLKPSSSESSESPRKNFGFDIDLVNWFVSLDISDLVFEAVKIV